MLALFWESRWGRSAADTEATNHAARQWQRAAALERENAALRQRITRLESELADAPHQRAANLPTWCP
jgi:cell division protein FtsB